MFLTNGNFWEMKRLQRKSVAQKGFILRVIVERKWISPQVLICTEGCFLSEGALKEKQW